MHPQDVDQFNGSTNRSMMNEQNEALHISNTVIHPAKRRRGRPRKEGNFLRKDVGSSQASPVNTMSETVTKVVQQSDAITNDENMIGKSVSGVIDGCFDAGFFLSVKIGNNGPILRGVIFEPGRVVPITSTNDIAPQAKLHLRTETPVQALSPRNQFSDVGFQSEKIVNQPLPLSEESPMVFTQVLAQPTASYAIKNQSASSALPVISLPTNIPNPSLPEKMLMDQNQDFKYGSHFMPCQSVESLRMVEQDDVMQVYEVSVQSEGLSAKNTISQSPSEQRANVAAFTSDGMNNKHNMGSGLHLSPQIQNDFLQCTGDFLDDMCTRKSVIEQNQITCDEMKGSYFSPQQQDAKSPSVFQVRESIQTQDIPFKDQQFHNELHTKSLQENEITRPNQELFQCSTAEVEQPNKRVNNEPENVNRNVIRQAFGANLSDDNQNNVYAASDTAKNDGSRSHLQTTNSSGVTMPLDLEIAAEELTGPGRPEFNFSIGYSTEREN